MLIKYLLFKWLLTTRLLFNCLLFQCLLVKYLLFNCPSVKCMSFKCLSAKWFSTKRHGAVLNGQIKAQGWDVQTNISEANLVFFSAAAGFVLRRMLVQWNFTNLVQTVCFNTDACLMKSYQFGKFIGADGSVCLFNKILPIWYFFCCCLLHFKTDACSMKF